MADQEQPDEKPAIDTHINIKVASKDNEVNFRIKKRTPLQKLMTTYCERQGKAAMSVRFTYDGKRIDGTMSPEDLDMEENDTIEVMIQQEGGRQV